MSDPIAILHPTDFSAAAAAAEAEAARLAQALDATLILLHVSVEVPLYRETPLAMADIEGLYAEQARWAERELADHARRLSKGGVKAAWRRRVGAPHAEIVAAAGHEHAAYIVMGTHGRSGLQRLMLGSVADRVVRTALCPVMTVRVPEEAAPPFA